MFKKNLLRFSYYPVSVVLERCNEDRGSANAGRMCRNTRPSPPAAVSTRGGPLTSKDCADRPLARKANFLTLKP